MQTESRMSAIVRFFLCFFLLCGTVYPLLPGTVTAGEKRSCIQTVDGYAYLSEKQTIGDLRNAAMANAKEQALKNARTYISSTTEVENAVLKSDLVLLQAEGSVTVLEVKDFGIEDNSRYHIWLKAEVIYQSKGGQPDITFGGENVEAALPPPDGPLTVRIWSPQQEYREGEKMVVYLKGNRDFHARIVNINAAGEVVQLLPNDFRTSSFFSGGTVYRIPDQGDGFDLTVAPPYGREQIAVYASEAPLGEVAMTSIGQGLRSFGGDARAFGTTTRGITVTAKQVGTEQLSLADFYEASYELTTRNK